MMRAAVTVATITPPTTPTPMPVFTPAVRPESGCEKKYGALLSVGWIDGDELVAVELMDMLEGNDGRVMLLGFKRLPNLLTS